MFFLLTRWCCCTAGFSFRFKDTPTAYHMQLLFMFLKINLAASQKRKREMAFLSRGRPPARSSHAAMSVHQSKRSARPQVIPLGRASEAKHYLGCGYRAASVTPLWVARTLLGLVGGFFGRRRRSGAKCRRYGEPDFFHLKVLAWSEAILQI